MNVGIIKSKKVCRISYFLGISVAKDQVRIGLIWWHIIFIFE